MGHEQKTAKTFDSSFYRATWGRYFTTNSCGGVRRKDFCYNPIPEFLSDIHTPSQNFEEVTKTIQHQRDKGSRAGSDNFVSSGHWNEVLI